MKPYGGFFVCLGLFLALAAPDAMAGGLVDTSVERFTSTGFTNPTIIDNPWWTLPAGANFLYFAEDGDDCAWNLLEVQGTTGGFLGAYSGVEARIVLDRGWVDVDCVYGDDFASFMASNPEPEEVTYDWYSQDDEKNIWYMGEDTFDGATYEGSFVAGCDGAEAGIVLLGNPSKGLFYSQEYYEDEAEDWGKVLNFITIDDRECMKTKEWTPLEPGAVEHKWYCSDGESGELTLIEELKGKTLIVELIDTNIIPPPAAGLPINPTPSCPF